MKVCSIVGARPQFVKAAALSRVLRKKHTEVLIHTGQHYDYNMSDVFFEELDIPKPDYNLGIGGGTHGKMTGAMLIAIEEVLLKENPDVLLVYGDTNSTLAGALSAVKLHIPVCHVEAGVRMETLLNPEEVNRILTDRIATLLFCCTQTAVDNLKKENCTAGVYNTGDIMYDAVLHYGQHLSLGDCKDILDFEGKPTKMPMVYNLLTCHREENTGTDQPLYEIFAAMNALEIPTVYLVHPRNTQRAKNLCSQHGFSNIMLIKPVGYLTSLSLIKNAEHIVTDSGGLQREAWFLKRPCITLLDTPPWPETLAGNINQLCKPLRSDILAKLAVSPDFSQYNNQFGDGHAAEKITNLIEQFGERR